MVTTFEYFSSAFEYLETKTDIFTVKRASALRRPEKQLFPHYFAWRRPSVGLQPSFLQPLQGVVC